MSIQRSQGLPVVHCVPDLLCCRFGLPGVRSEALDTEARDTIGRLGAELLDRLLLRGELGERLPDAERFHGLEIRSHGDWPADEAPKQPALVGKDRAPEGSRVAALQAWDVPDEGGVRLHGWYRLAGDPIDAVAGAERARSAVLAVNRSLEQANALLTERLREGLDAQPLLEGLRLIALCPSWLTAASQEAHVGAGPGVPPAPRPDLPSDWRPSYRFEAEAAGLADADGEGVVVAVLDSRPEVAQMLGAAQRYQPPHGFLQELLQRVQFGGLALDDPAFAALEHLVAGWEAGDPDGLAQGYAMPDHGLFVTGLIHGAAPGAELHLLRVLSAQGIGELQSLTALLGQTRALVGAVGKRLIVNLSLVAAIPSEPELETGFRPLRAAARRAAAGVDGAGGVPPLQRFLGGPLMDAVAALVQGGALVIASAGNDARPGQARPEPRLPARDDRILAVGAAGRSGQPASFSNAADALVLGNGVVAFGGEATWLATGARVDPDDAPIGLFTAAATPITGADVPTGWVAWSGTSFAAPLATALAARLWSSQPQLSAPELLAAVRAMAAGPDLAGLLAPRLPVTQVL